MAVKIANCVARMPEGSRPKSYKRVTARAVRRKLKAAQEPVPLRSSKSVLPLLTCIYISSINGINLKSRRDVQGVKSGECFLKARFLWLDSRFEMTVGGNLGG